MKFRFLTFLLCVFAFYTQALGNSINTNSVNTQEIDQRIQHLMQNTNMVGLSVAIVEGGELTFVKGYGSTLAGTNDPVTEDTVFRWASVSKGVAAAITLSLAEDGYLGLNSPIKAFAPSLNLPQSDHISTVEDILTHKTGLVRNAYDTRIEDGHDAKQVRMAFSELNHICEPGDCHTYQNVAFDALAEMIETVTDLPYKAVVEERLFKPLGMDTASLTQAGLEQSKSWAKPHNRYGYPITSVKPNYYRIPAAAGVNSSVRDLGLWMMAQMDTGSDVITESMRDSLHMPRVDTPREARLMRWRYHDLTDAKYGLGWRVYDYHGHTVVGHRGAVEGYRAQVLFDPDKKSGIAVMWNSPSGQPVGLQLEFLDQLYGLPKRDWMRLSNGS